MTVFILLAALLVVLVLVAIAWPLLRGFVETRSVVERKEANLGIFRDQLAELAREHAEGSLGAAEFEQAQQELRLRLLSEIPADAAMSPGHRAGPSRKTAVMIALTLPLLALAGYVLLGAPQALDPFATASREKMTPDQVEGMVTGLAERLKANPTDTNGWLMLARSYKMQGKNSEAAEAFARIESELSDDPDFLTDYADLLAMQAGGSLDGKPLALIKKALRANPDHIVALWLAGTAAFDQRDFVDAVVFWERAAKALPEESEDRQMLVSSIAEAKRRMAAKADPAKAVSGKVELSPSLALVAAPVDTVFILARPADGSRMPLAVAKLHVSELPFSFVLDDSLAMVAGKGISTHAEVIVEARVSRSGNAVAKEGDLESNAAKVRVGERGVRLLIDHTVAR